MERIQNHRMAKYQLASNVAGNNKLMMPKQISFGSRNLKQLLPNKADREILKIIIFGPMVVKFAGFVERHPRFAKFVSKFMK